LCFVPLIVRTLTQPIECYRINFENLNKANYQSEPYYILKTVGKSKTKVEIIDFLLALSMNYTIYCYHKKNEQKQTFGKLSTQF